MLTAAAVAAATAPVDAAVVQNAAVWPGRPTGDDKEHIQDEEPDGDVVEQRGLGKVGPELVRRPEKKGRRQQGGLHQFRRRATMRQLKNHVGECDHREGKRGEKVVTAGGKQARGSVFKKKQRNGGQRQDAEHQRDEFARAIGIGLHTLLFSAAGKEFIKDGSWLPQCESLRVPAIDLGVYYRDSPMQKII